MPYGSIISGLVNAGFDIYNQLSAQSPGSKAAAYSSAISKDANKYIAPFTNQSYWNLNLPAMANESINFGLANAPYINQQNMGQLQSLLSQAMPGWGGMFNQMQTNAGQLLQGQVPSDVQQQIQRTAAGQSIASGGYGAGAGAGTGTTGAITARDLGLTSLNLTQMGQTQGTNLLSFARNYLMPQPVNPMSLLPLSDLIQGQEYTDNATFQANEAMYTAAANAAAAKFGAPTTSVIPGVGGDISSIISSLGKSPSGQSGGSGSIFSSILGMFGGGSGGDNSALSSPSSASSGMSIGSMLGMAGGGG